MNPNLSQSLVPMPNADPTTHPPAEDSQSSAAAPPPQPRLRCADRQTLLPALPLEDWVAPEHPARTVWQFVQGLDLTSLLDGGFVKHAVCASLHMMPADIDTVSAPEPGCTVYAPVRQPQDASQGRYAPRATDSAAVAAWRQRRATPKAHAI